MGRTSILKRIYRSLDVILAFMVVAILSIMIIPISSSVLDIFLVVNIALSITVLMMTLFTKNVLEFSSFPTLLLLLTMYRLGLNLASTKLILGQGDAGEVIDAFASFVAGDNIIVGGVVFVIIIIIQLLVITSGASRVAEVAARFTLDAMPGKQMAIDADLNAGMMTEDQARKRREDLQHEADFYGAMDGSSKFVKGDAIAGIVITIVNLVGGIGIFVGQQGFSFGEAIDMFARLTIGDGLVSQIPAVMVSISSGILVTRAASEEGFGSQLGLQLLSKYKVIGISSVVVFLFSLIPAFPFFPFFLLAVAGGGVTYFLYTEDKKTKTEKADRKQAEAAGPHLGRDITVKPRRVDALAIEIGYGLLPLVDETAGGDLLERILMVRKQCALDLGVVIQPIRIRDNLQLEPNQYRLLLRGNAVGQGEIYADRFLVMDPASGEFQVEGIETVDPTFNIKALWVEGSEKDKAELFGYTVVDPPTVLVTQLKEMIKDHAQELLGRQEVSQILEEIKESYSVVIEELIPDILTLGDVQKVLQNLLREDVPIVDMGTILETLADYGAMTKDVEVLTEYVRHSLSRTIVNRYAQADGKLCAVTMGSSLEETIASHIQKSLQGSFPALEPQVSNNILAAIGKELEHASMVCDNVVLLTTPKIRVAVRNLMSSVFPRTAVLSLNEVPTEMEIEAAGMVELT